MRRTMPRPWRLLLVALAGPALLASLAFSRGGPAPAGRIVLAMNHFCIVGPPGDKGPADCGRGEIAVVDADGSQLRVLTHDKVTEYSPRWSADRRQIAFLRPKPHTSDQVWVMNADGTHQRALTRLRNRPQLFGGESLPNVAWDPSGRQIVFAAYPGPSGGVEQLYLVNVRTGKVTRLTNTPVGATDPVWSPDGRRIAFVSNVAPDRIFLLSTKTHRIHLLANGGTGGLAWSPDGHRLAFDSRGKITLLDVASRTYRAVGVWGDSPSWSPDGQWIVFCYGDYVKEVRPDGSGLHSILHVNSRQGRNFEPDW